MNENLSGVTKDIQNGSFQNVDYRGFTASPLLGIPELLCILMECV